MHYKILIEENEKKRTKRIYKQTFAWFSIPFSFDGSKRVIKIDIRAKTAGGMRVASLLKWPTRLTNENQINGANGYQKTNSVCN